MKRILTDLTLALLLLLAVAPQAAAQQRRPVDAQHPLWMVHVDVWYKADPQKIIDLIPEDIRPYMCMNLSLSCQYDKDKNVYKMPHYAFQTYKSWGTVCQQNGVWFTCQPASGGHTHIQDDDMATFEFFFKQFPNFLGWNYAEQFWGFDEAGDKSSSTQTARWALFARLVEMSHKYGGFLTVSFCGNIWSHPLNPIGEMKRNSQLLQASKKYPEAILWLYKYTTSACFYNNESVTWGPYISGLAKNYGVRYDNCGWNGAMDEILGSNHGKKYPAAAGIGTVLEQMCVNGAAVWDGPELTWREECFKESNRSTVDGYTRRNWTRFANMNGVWCDMFRKVIDGTIYIPTREEVVGKTKIVVINNKTSGSDEDKYATWGSLYDGLYKQTDPFNRGNGQWMNNLCYFKKTGRYGTIPMVIDLYDDVAKQIPVQVKKSNYTSVWGTQTKKVNAFNEQYPEVSTGDLYVNRYRNQLVTYTPYSYLNKNTTATASIPLKYNTCETLELQYDKLSSGVIREYADHIDFYLNNYRNDTTTQRSDIITLRGVTAEPTYTFKNHATGRGTAAATYDAESGTYTLTVKHCGAADVSISCSGAADRSTVAEAPIALQPLELPKQPDLYRGPIIIEAEDMDFKSIKSCATDPYNSHKSVIGHSGNGFMDMGTNTSGTLRHQLNLKAGQEGEYFVIVRYTCSTKEGNIKLTVNGTSQTVNCAKTAFNEWRTVRASVTLKEGKNNLLLANSGALPMYIDQIIYQPADVEPMKYFISIDDNPNGTVTPQVTEAAEGDTVTLSVKPAAGYLLKELRLTNSVFYTLEKTIAFDKADLSTIKFVMPHDNVTIQPVFEDVTAAYKLDLSSVSAGTMPPGWRCVQEDNQVHEYPNSYDAGARTFNGFNGYQGKALYWRNDCAEYGRQSAYRLHLEPGSFKLTYAMAAWKESPKYSVAIVNAASSATIAKSGTFTATPNAQGNQSASVSSAVRRELEFNITDAGNYIISFKDETTTGGYHEFLLLECNVNTTGTNGILLTSTATGEQSYIVYDASGRRRSQPVRGLNIIRTADGKTKKVIRK